VRERAVPSLIVFGAEPGAKRRAWLRERLPEANVEVLAGSGHFPHLAHPSEFAGMLVATKAWAGSRSIIGHARKPGGASAA
jgi:pimeloyl-ACP methyl ester carboxylesterase